MKIQSNAYFQYPNAIQGKNFKQTSPLKSSLKNINPLRPLRFADLSAWLSFKARLDAPYFLNLKDTWGDPVNADSQKMFFAYEKIENAANNHIYAKVQNEKPPIKKGDAVWSVTAEYRPIQSGGLGVVPADIKTNFEKFGIKMPVFLPLYHDGKNAIVKDSSEGKKTFYFKNSKFDLEKVAEFKTNAVIKGQDTPETVEVFKGNSLGREVYFISNMDYTFASIYGQTQDFNKNEHKANEKERFAFFTKAVHEFAAAKLDPERAKNFTYINNKLFDDIPVPDGFLLNDWHAGALAPLLRYKSVIQNLYDDLSFDAAEKLCNARIVTIIHNAAYQGEVYNKSETENILNTLFDQYATKIVQKGKMHIEGLHDLESPFVFGYANSIDNRHLNLLNMGVSLSDYVVPVSKNYTRELLNDPAVANPGWLYKQLIIRDGNGSLHGIINGNDKSLLAPDAENIELANTYTSSMHVKKLNFIPYDENDIDLHKKRLHNKEEFLNNMLIELMKNEPSNSDFVYADGNATQLEDTINILKNTICSKTPVYMYVGRMAGQKGLETLSGSIIGMFDNILNNPSDVEKPLPIFVLGGPDEEKGKYYIEMKHLKNQLMQKFGPEIANRVIVQSSFVPSFSYMLGADFIVAPSNFEPCGLIQSEAQAKGAIPITSSTGGFLDTIYDPLHSPQHLKDLHKGQTGYIAPHPGFDKSLERKVSCFKDVLLRTYNDYISNRENIEQIVKNAMHLDPSWIRADGKGPIAEYFDLFGYRPNIKTTDSLNNLTVKLCKES